MQTDGDNIRRVERGRHPSGGLCYVAREAKRERCLTDQKAAEPSSSGRMRINQAMWKCPEKGSGAGRVRLPKVRSHSSMFSSQQGPERG